MSKPWKKIKKSRKSFPGFFKEFFMLKNVTFYAEKRDFFSEIYNLIFSLISGISLESWNPRS